MNKQAIIDAVVEKLEKQQPNEQDLSVLIKLTPLEIFNICKMGAEYWERAKSKDTTLSMDDVCHWHTDLALGILQQTDPDRFEVRN